MPTQDARRTVAARAPDRREAVLAATLALLAAGGADAVTHRAVAEEAGLANGAVAYYFSSRAELLDTTYRHLAATEEALFRAALETSSATAPADVPGVLADVVARRLHDTRGATLARYELFLEAARRPVLRPVLAGWRDAYLRLISELLGRAGSPTASADAPLLLDALNGTLLALVALDEPDRARERLEQAIRRFL